MINIQLLRIYKQRVEPLDAQMESERCKINVNMAIVL